MTTAFEGYFERHFQTSLNHVGDEVVFSDGSPISRASWDRKAAYLLWVEIGRPGQDAVKTLSSPAPQLKTPSQKMPISDSDADFSDDDWDIA